MSHNCMCGIKFYFEIILFTHYLSTHRDRMITVAQRLQTETDRKGKKRLGRPLNYFGYSDLDPLEFSEFSPREYFNEIVQFQYNFFKEISVPFPKAFLSSQITILQLHFIIFVVSGGGGGGGEGGRNRLDVLLPELLPTIHSFPFFSLNCPLLKKF